MENNIKLCPHCRKEIDALATKCPYCQSKIRPKHDTRNLLLTALGVVIGIPIILVILASGNYNSSTNTSSNNSDQLSANVQTSADGVYVTNNESGVWTDCMVGLNGTDGFNFDNPPYKTRNPLSFSPNQQTLIAFSKITTDDGTSFDRTSHNINSVVIQCFQGTPNLRAWTGHSQ